MATGSLAGERFPGTEAIWLAGSVARSHRVPATNAVTGAVPVNCAVGAAVVDVVVLVVVVVLGGAGVVDGAAGAAVVLGSDSDSADEHAASNRPSTEMVIAVLLTGSGYLVVARAPQTGRLAVSGHAASVSSVP